MSSFQLSAIGIIVALQRHLTMLWCFVTIFVCLYGCSVAYADDNSAMHSRYAVERETRAVNKIIRGMAAQRKLLLGSTSVPVKSEIYKRFEKTGDYETAIKDFYSVKPSNVKEKKSYTLRVISTRDEGRVITGTVGNRRLILKESGEGGRPCIEVIETKFEPGPYIDMIVYKRADD